MKPVSIGITDCGKYSNYENWILAEPDVEVIRIGYRQNNLTDLPKCDGLLLTGGEDVHPALYHQPDYLKYCDQEDMDSKRDDIEWKVLTFAHDHRIPLLGICRGLQIGNVFFGGSLFPDHKAFGKADHAKERGIDRYHPINIAAGSLLSAITGTREGEVNSAHHQSVDRVAADLSVSAVSDDGIVEGLEWKHPEGKPFLQFVQWHPERMKDGESAFSKNVKAALLEAARRSK